MAARATGSPSRSPTAPEIAHVGGGEKRLRYS